MFIPENFEAVIREYRADPNSGFYKKRNELSADEYTNIETIYAEALQERSYPRGTFIFTQYDVEKYTPHTPAWKKAKAAEESLIVQYGAAWAGEALAPYQPKFRRGFVDSIALPKDQLNEFNGLAERSPVGLTELRVRGPRRVARMMSQDYRRQVTRQPAFRNLRSLDLSESGLTSTEIVELMHEMPVMERLQNLDLSSNEDLGHQMGVAFGHGGVRFPRLQSLNISRLGMGWEQVAYFTEALSRMPLLQSLDASHNDFEDYGMEVFASHAEDMRGLKELNLSHNLLRANGVAHLGRLVSRLPKLEALDVSHCVPENLEDRERGFIAHEMMMHLRNFPKLRHLRLAGNGMGYPGLQALLRRPDGEPRSVSRLETLDLSGNKLGAESFMLLKNMARGFTNLAVLDLADNYFAGSRDTGPGSDGPVEALAKSDFPALESIALNKDFAMRIGSYVDYFRDTTTGRYVTALKKQREEEAKKPVGAPIKSFHLKEIDGRSLEGWGVLTGYQVEGQRRQVQDQRRLDDERVRQQQQEERIRAILSNFPAVPPAEPPAPQAAAEPPPAEALPPARRAPRRGRRVEPPSEQPEETIPDNALTRSLPPNDNETPNDAVDANAVKRGRPRSGWRRRS